MYGHGSVRHLANTSGTITESYDYDAYGNRLDNTSASTNLLYSGEWHDSTAQQYYLRARWYSPANGRFNRMDPFSGNSQDPQSLHKYLYVHNNPVNNIDPTGQFFTAIGQITTWAIQKTIRGINVGTAYVAKAYMTASAMASTLMWRVYFGYQQFCTTLYRWGSVLTRRLPQAVWQRVTESFRNNPQIISRAQAELTGFNSHSALSRFWHKVVGGEIHLLVQGHEYNIRQFGMRAIHSLGNSVAIPRRLHQLITNFTNSAPGTLGLDPARYGHVSHMYEYTRRLPWKEQYRWGVEMYNYVMRYWTMQGFNPG